MTSYKNNTGGYDFNSKFDTYILAYCPDTASWFATDERFFYYEHLKRFLSEKDASSYFTGNPSEFLEIEKEINPNRPSWLKDRVVLENGLKCTEIQIKD